MRSFLALPDGFGPDTLSAGHYQALPADWLPTVSARTVKSFIRFKFTSNPIPGLAGAAIVPCELTVTGGSIMSSSQYRALAETSPGKVNPARVAMAMLCARPIPDSSIPPHHTGILRSLQTCSTCFALE